MAKSAFRSFISLKTCSLKLTISNIYLTRLSFQTLEQFTTRAGYTRTSKVHKEICPSDFRRVPEAKRKTILRVTPRPAEK